MIIRHETPADVAARERILDTCFGQARFRKTCHRLRVGRRPADGLALVAERDGALAGTIRLWKVEAGGRPALMLGPVAVDPALQNAGLGTGLIRAALARARALGHEAVLLVGDAAFYERFGFTQHATEGLYLPGPYLRERFLALELAPGALAGAAGPVVATGEPERAGPDAPELLSAAA